MELKKLNSKLNELYNGNITCKEVDGSRILSGKASNYQDILDACFLSVSKDKNVHVVNDIVLEGKIEEKIRKPLISDNSLEGKHVDVLVIGGGISGCSILRELSRYNLDLLLVDKESDLANQTSSRNDGEIHPGVDLNKGSIKQSYVVRANRIYDKLCEDLDVPFKRIGQYAGFTEWYMWPVLALYTLQRRFICKVDDTRLVGRRFIRKNAPNLNKDFKFAIYNKMAGVISPYEFTIAYGENAVENGAKISLDTMVNEMEVVDGKIVSVLTNRGKVYPKLVINAAGVFSEDIAKMAQDRFFSIHPRKGTIVITDKKANYLINTISSIKQFKGADAKAHSKGGGSIRTVHDNVLLGPDAVETYFKEDFSTENESLNKIFAKQEKTIPGISRRDIITYFSGYRAATFEEDFIIEKGRKTSNIFHVAGIQSPGLTTAPLVAIDVAKEVVNMLSKEMEVKENTSFNPKRRRYPVLNKLSLEERDKLIKQNPDYGVIICRCEEISKGEIIDCLNRPVHVASIDAIKRRIRPGMGRCQGGFCMPLVAKIIADHENIELKDVKKSNDANKLGYYKKGEVPYDIR